MTHNDMIRYLDSAIRFKSPVSTEFLKEIMDALIAMQRELARHEDDGK